MSDEQTTAARIQQALTEHLRSRNVLLVPNVFVLGSPWESDLIAVTPRCYWTEYEIKLSVADYRNDFQKRINGFSDKSPRKHERYVCEEEVGKRWGRIIPKPKHFYFVTPKGLLDGVDVPNHCGILEFDPDSKYRYRSVQEVRKAPRLKKPTQLSQETMFNLAVKVSTRVAYQPA